jgi:hypothetical protein
MGQDGFYFRSEGRRAEDFFVLKNPTASAGFEPAWYQRPARYFYTIEAAPGLIYLNTCSEKTEFDV